MESLPPLNTTVFIYALTEPTGEIRYIGKSNAPARRFAAHLRDRGNNHKTCWIQSLRSQGLSPLWEILDEVSAEYWQQWEAAYIQFFLEEGCDLVNGTKGGEGTESGKKKSPETRKRMSVSRCGKNYRFGKKHTQETRKRMSDAATGEKNHNFGKSPSAETRENISRAVSIWWENRKATKKI